jgi:hypothetical protein
LLSKLRVRYRKAVGEYKDIENNFYSDNSLNDDLERILEKLLETLTCCCSRIEKDPRRPLVISLVMGLGCRCGLRGRNKREREEGSGTGAQQKFVSNVL